MNDDMWICPNCGAELKQDAKFCKECGADKDHGWGDDDYSSSYDLPDDDDYNAMVEKEFGKSKSPESLAKQENFKKFLIGTIAILMGLLILYKRVLRG